jgi:hypothetical protein
MSNNKKIWLVFVIFVIIPVMSQFLLSCFSKGKYFYEYNCSTTSFVVFSFAPLFGGVLMAYLNYKSNYKSKIWYIMSFSVIVINVIYLLILNSLSHIGF